MPKSCALCQRQTKTGTTEHHLIPRTLHSNKWFKKRFTRIEMRRTIPVCRECHRAIHELVSSPKELGRHYNTLDRLRDHPELSRFIDWASRQR